ncbi:hypothetical protein [Paraburkholderia sacchari]|uniref:hypothetical protein n=1 Tax=Paraburkholderia sacchari TaxID=159450 RepID=UPI003D96C9C8
MSDMKSAEGLRAEVDKLIAERARVLIEEFELRRRSHRPELAEALYPFALLIGGMGAGAALLAAAIALARQFHG